MWAPSTAEVGKIITTARRHRGLTQAQLAKAVGVTQAWVSAIEQGKDNAQIGRVLRVLSFLGVRLRVGEAPWLKSRKREQLPGVIALSDIIASHAAPRRKKAAR